MDDLLISMMRALHHTSASPRAALRLAAAFTAAVALLLTAGDVARAGTYPMHSCNVPGELPTGTGPWAWQHSQFSTSYSECATAGGFGFQFPSEPIMAPNSSAVLNLTRPTRGAQTAIGIRQVKLWLDANLASSGSALYVTSHAVSGGEIKQTDILGSPSPTSMAWTSPLLDPQTSQFSILLYCSTSTPAACTLSNRVPLEVAGSEATLYESVPPALAVTGGSLMSGGRQSGQASVAYDASDGESGIARIEVLLGGQLAGSTAFSQSARCRYDNWNACDTRVVGSLIADTGVVPDGVHQVQLRVTDAAANQRVVQLDQPVVVANANDDTLDSPNGDAATTDALLSASFAHNRSHHLVTNWRSGAVVRGRLVRPAATAIGGAKLDILERVQRRGAGWQRRGQVTTDGQGSFSFIVPARLSSRRIRIVYRPSRSDSTAAAVRDLILRVRAAAELRVSLAGVDVRYSGRVLSTPVPTGKVIHMQGRAVGGAWQTFAIRRTTRSGRFSGHYRLRVRRPGVRLQFRVRVPEAENYPFAMGQSAPVTRRVR